jgi:replicative DNA helicase
MIEKTILENLTQNEEYSRRVLPFLQNEYFTDDTEKYLFSKISGFISKYNTLPDKNTLTLEIDEDGINEGLHKTSTEYVKNFGEINENIDWLIDTTEKFCQEKAVYNAIMQSIKIIDGKDKQKEKGSIPDILSDALAVSFDDRVGHDYFEDAESRFDFYQKVEDRVPFDLEYMNLITGGGLPNKTLNVILAGTGVGKTLAMCHMAAANIKDGKNVLYITLEMAEERISERIDANLLNVPLDQIKDMSKKMFSSRVNDIQSKANGKLVVKEYPTAAAHSGNFRYLMNELVLKKNFTPDIVYIDYLNICGSMRMKMTGSINSYTYIKAIAEELRGLAVEKDLPIVTATQLNRSGYVNSDPGLEDTSESFGLPATADFMMALISNDEMAEMNQIMVKQLKNRYNDPATYRKFMVGVDRPKMRLFDVEQEVEEEEDDIPVFDNTTIGKSVKRDFSKLIS